MTQKNTEEVHQLNLDAMGKVLCIRLIEPLCNQDAKVFSAKAIALECRSGVLVAWQTGIAPKAFGVEWPLHGLVRWSQLDHPTWALRRDSWMQANQQCAMPSLLVRDASQFMDPSKSPAILLGARLSGVRQAHLQPSIWEVQARSEAGVNLAWKIGSRQVDFVDSDHRPDNVRAIPQWLDPASIVHVRYGQTSFQRASFDGWPLAWRRAYATHLGLSSHAPVNCRSVLPTEARDHPSMSEWTCMAMALRIRSSASMCRQIKQLACPPELNGIRPDHLEIWWPQWRAL